MFRFCLCLFFFSFFLLPYHPLIWDEAFLFFSSIISFWFLRNNFQQVQVGKEDKNLPPLSARQWGGERKDWWVQACCTEKQFEDVSPRHIQALTAVSEHIHFSGSLSSQCPVAHSDKGRRGYELFSKVMPRLWQRCELIPGHLWLRLLPSSLN